MKAGIFFVPATQSNTLIILPGMPPCAPVDAGKRRHQPGPQGPTTRYLALGALPAALRGKAACDCASACSSHSRVSK